MSHIFGSALCYCIFSEKGKVLSSITGRNLTSDKPRDPTDQEWIHDYHGLLEAAIGSEEFDTSLDGYDSFINYDEEDILKGEPN